MKKGNDHLLSKGIKSLAINEGVDLVGIASVDRFKEASNVKNVLNVLRFALQRV